MPAIIRQDGEQFAVYTYRELLAFKKPGLLKREIELLREENGDYARFYVQDNGDIEAVFSRDSGYLLAESAWEHFGKPADLVYCEVLPGGEAAILIVIRAGAVYLDAEVPTANLLDEFSPLATGNNQYQIYLYGDVPLAETGSETVFAFEPAMVKSFKVLEQSALQELPLNEDYRLLPVKEAVAQLRLSEINLMPIILLVILLVGGGYFLYKWLQPPPAPPLRPMIVDPYQQYEAQLTSPAPTAILNSTAAQLRRLFTVPGWEPRRIQYKDNNLTIDLVSPLNATGNLLLHWVKQRNMEAAISEDGATLSIPLKVPNRAKPKRIYDLKEVLSNFFDETHLTLPGSNITISKPVKMGKFSSSEVNVSFSGLAPSILNLYGKVLRNKPLVLESFRFTMNTGLISGEMKFKALGA